MLKTDIAVCNTLVPKQGVAYAFISAKILITVTGQESTHIG
jgi:hypothetical protein